MINSNVTNHVIKKALGLNSFTTNMAASGELKCIDSSPFRHDSEFILKEEQRNAIKAFVNRKDVFAFLPTGSGKSLMYQLAPWSTLWSYYVALIGSRSIQLSEEAFFFLVRLKHAP